MINTNPFARFKRLPKQPADTYHFDESQLAKLFTAIWDEKPSVFTPDRIKHEARKRLIPIYLYTGLRRNEVLTLQRDCIDLKNNRILVTNIKHRQRLKRYITIPASIRTEIQWFMDSFPDSTHPFAVCAPGTITHDVKRWIRAAKLSDSLHLHSLRHTFITLALRYESIWRIKDHVGHTRIETTQGYAHTDVDDGIEINIGFDITAHRESGKNKL